MEDVINESISIMGHTCYYIPRESYSPTDYILGENVQSKFVRAYPIVTYLCNVEGYEGDGDFFSKFGLDIRDSSNFVFARREFERYVPANITPRPREGDLLYVPVMRKIFEVKFIEEELMFFSLGKRDPYIYELRCELFRFSQEDIDTGIEEIDAIEPEIAYTMRLNLKSGGSGVYQIGERVYQGATVNIAQASGEVSYYDEGARTLDLINIIGTFAVNTAVKGTVSGANHLVDTDVDTIGFYADRELTDNKQLGDEANTIIDKTEQSPFGMP